MNKTEIDEIYEYLGIKESRMIPNNVLNTGSLNKRLNSNYSIISGENSEITWDDNTRTPEVSTT